MSKQENIIEIHHLNKSFGKVKAVNDLSFRVKRGELFAFLGVNGAGKIAVEKITEYLNSGVSFNQETTLCGKSIIKIL